MSSLDSKEHMERRRRQRAVLDDDSIRFELVMTEGALRWQVGSPDVMLEQVERVRAVMRHPNVLLGLIPWSQVVRVFAGHAFHVYDKRIAVVGTAHGVERLTQRDVVDRYVGLFGQLSAIAVYGKDADDLLTKIADGYSELVEGPSRRRCAATKADRSTVNAVVFDIGETLRDDTAEFAAWADWLDVPRHTFSALIGGLRVLGRPTNDAFSLIRPGFDLEAETKKRVAAGVPVCLGETDLYPDVRKSLGALRAEGLWVGIAGNQTAEAAVILRSLDLPVSAIATSGEWGVTKPSSAFFDCVAEMVPFPRHEILYVGDHRDNDVVAASRAGLQSAFVRRGPWGLLWADDPKIGIHASLVISSLEELPRLLRP